MQRRWIVVASYANKAAKATARQENARMTEGLGNRESLIASYAIIS
jgi:hypothetical protein